MIVHIVVARFSSTFAGNRVIASRVSTCTGPSTPFTGQSFFLDLPALDTQSFHLFLDHFPATDPTSFHLLLLDKGAFHKARALQLPPNLGVLLFPPYTPALNPIERLRHDLKDGLAQYQPASLRQLSVRLGKRLKHYSAATLRSRTGFPYLLKTAQTVTGL
jgi:hypothetical protein